MRPALLLKVSKALGFLTGPVFLFLGFASLRPAVCKLVSNLRPNMCWKKSEIYTKVLEFSTKHTGNPAW